MEITRTHTRNLKKLNRHYERFMVEDGLKLWYVFCLNKKIDHMRERTYFDETKDDCSEKAIPALPQEVFALFDKLGYTY